MRCSSCGKEIRPYDTFCPECGIRVSGVKESPRITLKPGLEEPGTRIPTSPLPAPPVPPMPPPAPGAPSKRRTSGFAIASLVMGILGYFCLFFIGSVLAVVFGLIAKHDIKKSDGELQGSGLATAGIVLGIVLIGLLFISAAIWFPLAISNVGPTRTMSQTVELEGAHTVKADIDMKTGRLDVEGGAGSLFEADFVYNVKKWKPEVDYKVSDSKGDLTVTQSGRWVPTLWNRRNDWNIRLNDEVPIQLKTRIGSGNGFLDLRSLSLLGLEVDSSSGEISADLSGDMPSLENVKVKQSSGGTTLILEGKYSSPIKLDVNSSTGDIEIDLLGQWLDDLEGAIKASSGDVTVFLPEEVGVYVKARTSSGDINASDMIKRDNSEDGVYVNEAYGDSKIILHLDIRCSSGDINLVLGD